MRDEAVMVGEGQWPRWPRYVAVYVLWIALIGCAYLVVDVARQAALVASIAVSGANPYVVRLVDRAFFVVDPDLRIAGLFGRWVQSAGLDSARWIGRTPAQLFPETQGQPHEDAFRRALAGGDVTYEADVAPAPGAEPARLRISLSPMRDTDGSTKRR